MRFLIKSMQKKGRFFVRINLRDLLWNYFWIYYRSTVIFPKRKLLPN